MGWRTVCRLPSPSKFRQYILGAILEECLRFAARPESSSRVWRRCQPVPTDANREDVVIDHDWPLILAVDVDTDPTTARRHEFGAIL
jgi:hypothetical protein